MPWTHWLSALASDWLGCGEDETTVATPRTTSGWGPGMDGNKGSNNRMIHRLNILFLISQVPSIASLTHTQILNGYITAITLSSSI